MPSRATPSASIRARLVVGLDLADLLAERDRAEPAQPAGADAGGRCIEGDLIARFDARAEMRLDLGKRQRRGEQHPALRRGARDLADREKRLARQRRRLIDIGAAPIREHERTAGAAALGDAVGIGERKQHAGREISRRILSPRDASRSPPPRAQRVVGRVGGGGRLV